MLTSTNSRGILLLGAFVRVVSVGRAVLYWGGWGDFPYSIPCIAGRVLGAFIIVTWYWGVHYTASEQCVEGCFLK